MSQRGWGTCSLLWKVGVGGGSKLCFWNIVPHFSDLPSSLHPPPFSVYFTSLPPHFQILSWSFPPHFSGHLISFPPSNPTPLMNRRFKVMVINSTNIKTNNHLSPKTTEHKKATTYGAGNPGSGSTQTQKSGELKPVNRTPTLSHSR